MTTPDGGDAEDILARLMGGSAGDDEAPSDAASAGGVWVIVSGALSEDDERRIATARSAADSLGASVSAVLAGGSRDDAARACHCGADRALLTGGETPDALAALVDARRPDTMLVSADEGAARIGARVAERAGGAYLGVAVALEVDTSERRLLAHGLTLGGQVVEVRAADDAVRPHVVAVSREATAPAFPDPSRPAVVEEFPAPST